MQAEVTCLLLLTITAGSIGKRFSNQGEKDQHSMEMSLEDLMEAENTMSLRNYAAGICNVHFVKVGCFKEVNQNRALTEELFQDRNSGDPNYSKQDVDWSDYATYLKGLACRCAKKSQEKGFTYFGLQDYARCFSGAHAASTYSSHGPSDGCLNHHSSACDDNAWGLCVGNTGSNYVYEIKEASSGDGEIVYGRTHDDETSQETK